MVLVRKVQQKAAMSDRSNQTDGTVRGWMVVTIFLFILALALFYSNSSGDFVPILDHANLAFHEAGHIFFGLLGNTAGLYGGTLGQYVFPSVAFVTFLKKANWFAAALCLLWLFQNMIYMARYMADARAQQLPLVGGGDHDWTNIFSRWNVLNADVTIAHVFTVLAWLGMLATLLWLGKKWLLKTG